MGIIETGKNRRARIVATVGPATASSDMLGKLLKSGVNVFRFNFSHGNREEHVEVIADLRKQAEAMEKHVAIMQDLQGPRIRTGTFPDGCITLSKGETVQVFYGEEGEAGRIPLTYEGTVQDMEPGMRILLSDGNIELSVISKSMRTLECRVVVGGILHSRKGVNLPDTDVKISALTDKDREDAACGAAAGVDLVALSFVRSREDVDELRSLLDELNSDAWIVAKLERPEAVIHLDSILMAADAVMVARGDLGVEMRPEQVPLLQKRIIYRANSMSVPVITATQMLESMVDAPGPTRAEASDVANAVIDGTDALMLSGETAAGQYPLECVRMMDRIIRTAESYVAGQEPVWVSELTRGGIAGVVARAAYTAEKAADVGAVIACTMGGSTARLISKCRPESPIIGASPFRRVLQKMSLLWGVIPLEAPYIEGQDCVGAGVETAALAAELLQPGEAVVLLSGSPCGGQGSTDTMRLYRLPGATKLERRNAT